MTEQFPRAWRVAVAYFVHFEGKLSEIQKGVAALESLHGCIRTSTEAGVAEMVIITLDENGHLLRPQKIPAYGNHLRLREPPQGEG